MKKSKIQKYLLEFLILTISLALLLFIGLGESLRTFTKFQREGIYALVEPVKLSIESMLYAGLPLMEFSGYNELTEPVCQSNESVKRIEIIDIQNRDFVSDDENKPYKILFSTDLQIKKASFKKLKDQEHPDFYTVYSTHSVYRMDIPLENRFDRSGYIRVYIDKQHIIKQVTSRFYELITPVLVILLLYLLFLFIPIISKIPRVYRYSVFYFMVSFLIILTMVDIYYIGIKEKTDNLAQAINKRLEILHFLNIENDEVNGFDEVFSQYMFHNPEISSLCLKYQGKKLLSISQETEKISDKWKTIVKNGEVEVSIGIRENVVLEVLWSGIKQFFTLFIASIILSFLFIDLLSIRKRETDPEKKLYYLKLVKPVFFLAVFSEALNASFLPIYFHDIAPSHFQAQLSSVLFAVFFIAYSLIIVPAENLCIKKGTKYAVLTALLINTLSLINMVMIQNYFLLILIRTLSGLAQGMLFISLQNYIININVERKKASAMAILITQYFAARISGTAIGSLIFTYVDARGTFMVSSVISFLAFLLALKWISQYYSMQTSVPVYCSKNKQNIYKNMRFLIKDSAFRQSMFAGINAKIIMIGIVSFALPLLLGRIEAFKGDIGQMMMIYYLSVLGATFYASKLADRAFPVEKLIKTGHLISISGLILFGFISSDWLSPLSQTICLYLSIILPGLGNGLIATPVTVSILNSKTADVLGRGETLSLYRLSERLGNISGPLLFGILLSISHNPLIITGFGIFLLLISGISTIVNVSKRFLGLMFILMISYLSAEPIELTKHVLERWNVKHVSNAEIYLSAKVESGKRSPDKIMVVLGKESSAFTVALESALKVFEDKTYYPSFYIVNYQGNPKRAEMILKKAVSEHFQLVFAMGSLATDYVFNHFEQDEIPVVSICAKDPVLMKYVENYNDTGKRNIAYTSLNIPVEYQMLYLKKLINPLKNICVIYEKSNESAFQTQVLPVEHYAQDNHIGFYEVSVDKPVNARKELKEKCRQILKQFKQNDPDLSQSVFIITGSTSVFNHIDVINQVSENTLVFGLSPSMIGEGENSATISIGVSFELNAHLSAIYAIKILKENVNASELKVGVISPPEIAVNLQQAGKKQIKIPFSLLEAAGIIIDKNGRTVKNNGKMIHSGKR